jgi:hypothetical protein
LTATFILAEIFFFGILFFNFGKSMKINFPPARGPDPFNHIATQYYELRGETICIGKPTISAFQCVKNQLPTRSGSIYIGKPLSEVFKQFSGPNKVLKT